MSNHFLIAYLSFSVPPYFVIAPSDVYVLEGWAIYIPWSVYGVPTPTVTLLRNSKPVQGKNSNMNIVFMI